MVFIKIHGFLEVLHMETKEAKGSDVKDEKLLSESKQQNCVSTFPYLFALNFKEHEFLVLKMLFGGLEEKTDKMNEEISLQHLMIDQFRKGIRREMQEKTSEIIRASTAALESRLDILEKENNILREELQKARNFESKKSSSILQPQKKSLLPIPSHNVGPQPGNFESSDHIKLVI